MTKRQFFKLGSIAQLAKLTGKSPSTIYRWRREGIPKSINLDQYIRKKKSKKKESAERKPNVAKLKKEIEKAKKPPPKEKQRKRIKEIKKAEIILEEKDRRREERRKIREKIRKEEAEWAKEAPLRKITPGRNKANIKALAIQRQLLRKTKSERERYLIEYKIEILENWIDQSQKEGPFRYFYFDDRDVVDYADLEDISIHEAYDELYGY